MIETNTVHFIVLSSWELKKKDSGNEIDGFFLNIVKLIKILCCD
jgi:hypothetical protein